MKHRILLKIKHFLGSIFEFTHIPNLGNIAVEIKHFQTFTT